MKQIHSKLSSGFAEATIDKARQLFSISPCVYCFDPPQAPLFQVSHDPFGQKPRFDHDADLFASFSGRACMRKNGDFLRVYWLINTLRHLESLFCAHFHAILPIQLWCLSRVVSLGSLFLKMEILS